MSSRTIAERIRFVLSADSAQLERGMGRAGRTVRTHTRDMQREFATLRRTALRLTGVIAGLAGAAGLQALIRQSIQAADEIRKLGLRTGETSEFLSTLAFAAEQNDATLDGLARGMRNLAQQMDRAAQGGAGAVTLFERLNVAALSADGNMRGAGETLLDIADRFRELQSPVERAALAQELFGRSGEELIPLMLQGRQGIEELQAAAARYGREISGRMAQRAERFNDQMNVLRSRAQGVGLTLADQMLPLLLAVSQEFDEAADGASGFGAALNGVTGSINIIALGLRGLIFLLEMNASAAAGLAAAGAELASGNMRGALNILRLIPDDISSRFEGLTQFHDMVFESEERITRAVRERQAAREAETRTQDLATSAAEEQQKAEQAINDLLGERNRELDEARRNLEAQRAEVDDLEALFARLRGVEQRGAQPESVLDVQRLRADAQRALAAGDLDDAVEKTREAARIIEELQRDDDVISASAATIRDIERIALEAARSREQLAEQEVATLEQQVATLKQQLEGAGDVAVRFDESEMDQAAADARDYLERLFMRQPLEIPIVGAPDGGAGGLQRFHSGGLSAQEQMAVLLRGEGVLNRGAMDFIGGASGLAALNQQQSPAAIGEAGGAGNPVHLHMDGQEYVLRGSGDETARLVRAFRRQALKTGRRN